MRIVMGQASKILFLLLQFRVVLILTLFCISSSALKCYTCDYEEDMVHHYNCKDQPDKACLFEVEEDDDDNENGIKFNDDQRPLTLTSWYGQRMRKLENNYRGPPPVVNNCDDDTRRRENKFGLFPSGSTQWKKKNPEKLCVKATGKIDGKSYVSRFGVRVKNPKENFRKDGCNPIPDEEGLTDGLLCFCHKDACNGSSVTWSSAILSNKMMHLILSLMSRYFVT